MNTRSAPTAGSENWWRWGAIPLAAAGFATSFGPLGCQVAFGDFSIDTRNLSVNCESNVVRCESGQLQSCVSGNEWRTLLRCETPASCNVSSQSCAACQPGSYQCNGAKPQLCSPTREWLPAAEQPCASAASCVVPEDGSAAHCLPPECPAENELRCFGEHLQRCPLNRRGWEDVEICASAALCDAAHAKAQLGSGAFPTCLLPACKAGQFDCATGSPAPCNTQRTGYDLPVQVCEPGTQCNPAAGDCSVCLPGTYTCSGSQLAFCTAEQVWTGRACGSALSCDAAASACQSAVCEPGAVRCDGLALERCRSDGGQWEPLERCLNQALCNPKSTRCEVPQCMVAGAKRCTGNSLQACRENLTGWSEVMLCPSGTACDPKLGCVPGVCVEGSRRCNDSALEQCTGQVWVREERCQTAALCDSENQRCNAATCNAGERECSGPVLRRCNAGLNGWDELGTCLGGSVCNPATKRCEPR